MTTIDKSGSSIEDIIREFRRDHSIRDHELQYEILKKPSKGFLGFFANKLALVRFQVPETEDRVRLFTETLLAKMGISFSKIHTFKEGRTLHLSIEGIVETGFVIGKNGQMLETIQYLVNRVFESDRKLEQGGIDSYNAAIKVMVEEKDNGSKQLLEGILEEEEAHIDYFEEQLGQIEQMGLPYYLTTIK